MSLQAFKSFFGGTFFGGEFFEQKAYGTLPLGVIPATLKARTRTRRDVLRGRGFFQVLITAEKLIELVAARHLDSDDQEAISDLHREFTERFMEWEQKYASDMAAELERQRAERDRKRAAEAKELADWIQRRQRKLMRMH